MAAAIDIARYLIHLASSNGEEDADLLSPLRLQKLLYYAQGWHLALVGDPLFDCRVESWKYGPVVAEVYHTFKSYGSASLPAVEGVNPDSMPSAQKSFLALIWEMLKGYSATALSRMTHLEPPWIAAGSGNGGTITTSSMRTYFLTQIGRLKGPFGEEESSVPAVPVSPRDVFLASLADGVGFARAVANGTRVDFPPASIALARVVDKHQEARCGEDARAWADRLAREVAGLTD